MQRMSKTVIVSRPPGSPRKAPSSSKGLRVRTGIRAGYEYSYSAESTFTRSTAIARDYHVA
jgi:hypothetical protein